jgi:peptide/nickel transport system permease protein
MVFLPSAVLFFTVLSLNFVGDRLLERFDVREAAL